MSWLSRLMPRRQAPVPDPMALARSRAEAGDHEGALALWEPLARAGDARACNNIGACFAEGLGVPRDAALAHLEAREREMTHETELREAELATAMQGLREARAENDEMRDYIARLQARAGQH